MTLQGCFELKTPSDLREKLRRDFDKLRHRPFATDEAFNFFVTAKRLLDWTHLKGARQTEPLLRVVSHIAIGAKHFRSETGRHTAVGGTGDRQGAFARNAFAGNAFDVGGLTVELDDADAQKLYGTSKMTVKLAEKVLEYWNRQSL